MPKIVLPGSLRDRTDGTDEVEVAGRTAAEALESLESDHPRLKGWVLDERGRIRDHIKVFLGEEEAGPDTALSNDDRLHVVRAISGGAPDDTGATGDTGAGGGTDATGDGGAPGDGGAAGDGGAPDGGGEIELLLGTHKGLIVLRGERDGTLDVAGREFPGQPVEYAIRDRRSGTYVASVTHGQHGPHLFLAEDPLGEWEEAEGPAFPPDTDAAVKRIWVVEPGVEEGVLWAGVAPAALFRSDDDGRTWELNRGLWDHPTRPEWQGGMGGLCLHSICPWPDDPARLAVAISAVGVWITEDGGETWTTGVDGLVPRYLPEEARADTLMHCVHDMKRAPARPETLYMQFHGGVYRSDDAGRTWIDVGAEGGLPADFGFPLVVDPHDPDRAFVIPLVADTDRVTPGGRLRVYETRDRGNTWRASSRGLPQEHAYLTVLRQAFADDGRRPLGLYFGAESGELFGSVDGGASWRTLASRLPPIYSVRVA